MAATRTDTRQDFVIQDVAGRLNDGPMRILIEPSDYMLLNVGDMAMLQVAFQRIRSLWPNASIQILTDDPEHLALYCPGAEPLMMRGRQIWFTAGNVFGILSPYLSASLEEQLIRIEKSLRRRLPGLVEMIIRLRMKYRGIDDEDLNCFLSSMAKADLVVVTGMGGITDVFLEYALELLDSLGLAIRRGTSTVMFGQGIGPIQNQDLKTRAKEILPQVDFISLREGRASKKLLQTLGVSPNRVFTTGDDAIEIAYGARAEQLENGIGINIRAGIYSDVDPAFVQIIRPILQKAAETYKTVLVPVPISHYPHNSDASMIRKLTAGYDRVVDGCEDLDTPLKVIQQIQRCRVVITGSYHAAVFALAQGIPTVGLANSEYYADKFLGLADQFGAGVEVIFLNERDLSVKLTSAIEKSWESADRLRPQLLDSAARQVEVSRAAYKRAYELVTPRPVATFVR